MGYICVILFSEDMKQRMTQYFYEHPIPGGYARNAKRGLYEMEECTEMPDDDVVDLYDDDIVWGNADDADDGKGEGW